MSDQSTPPSSPEPGATPEYLDSHEGDALTAPPAPRRTRRNVIIGGVAVAGLAVAGVGAWAVTSFLKGGPDAAGALPADTIAFASVNLDPSGSQKIAALETLKKFPGLKDKLDFGTADDVRQKIFEAIQKSGECGGVDYAADVKPWLGNTMAVAAIDAGESHPSAVVLFQVTDQDKAKAGLDKIDTQCSSDATKPTGVAFEDGWAVVAEKQDIADKVVAGAKQGNLADDATYQRWSDQAGDSGIITMYAAPSAGAAIGDVLESKMSGSPFTGTELPQANKDQLEKFKGGAAVVRFHDGALEMEFAADFNPQSTGLDWSAKGAGDLVGSLPGDTAFALGMSLPHGFVDYMLDAMAPAMGPGMTVDQLKAQFTQETGLTLPDDIEALTGDSLALSVSSHFDLEKIANAGDPSSVEVGLKVKGDAAKANAALDKIRAQLGPAAQFLVSKDKDGYFAVGPDSSYLDTLLEQGDLGDDSTFKDVVTRASDASSLFYLNLDAGDNWLVNALKGAGAPAEVTDNVEPLSAIGLSGWYQDSVSHGVFKITTD